MPLPRTALRTLLLSAALAGAVLPPLAAGAQELVLLSERKVVATVVSDGFGPGPAGWRSQVQQVFDPKTWRLERRLYTLFDPAPDRGLDVLWRPADPARDRAGRIAGRGTLVWRDPGTLDWDKAAIVATYTGDMRGGQPEGTGELVTRDGLAYRGGWRAGRFEGEGEAHLPGGETYEGAFAGGFAEGPGRFTDTTGERFDGPFRAGLPEGSGATTLPSGLSYTSSFRHGVESAASRRLRLAQAGAPDGGGGDDLRVGVTVPRKPVLPPDLDAGNVVTYTASSQGATLVVGPADKQLMAIWKGNGELQDFEYDAGESRVGVFGFTQSLLDAAPPTFQIDLQNRSDAPIEIVGLRLDVAESKLDAQPAVEIGDFSQVCSPEPLADYRLHNYGWSPVRDGVLRFSFGQGSGGTDVSKPIGTVQAQQDFSFIPELRAAGVRVADLKKLGKAGLACHGLPQDQCFEQVKASPLFGPLGRLLVLDGVQLRLPVRGTFDYTWQDVDGQDHQRSSPFSLDLYLANLPREVECGEGAAPEVLKKAAVKLQLNAADYSLPLSFHRAIAAGQTNRLSFALTAEKSSHHRFRLTALLADGRAISSRPVDMTFFRPRPQQRS